MPVTSQPTIVFMISYVQPKFMNPRLPSEASFLRRS
jgi:hypothetical protein